MLGNETVIKTVLPNLMPPRPLADTVDAQTELHAVGIVDVGLLTEGFQLLLEQVSNHKHKPLTYWTELCRIASTDGYARYSAIWWDDGLAEARSR